MRIFTKIFTDHIFATIPPCMPSSVRKPDRMRTFCRPLYFKKKIIWSHFLIRKYIVNNRLPVDILNPTMDKYTCQLLFSDTILNCLRCLTNNNSVLRSTTSLCTVRTSLRKTESTFFYFFCATHSWYQFLLFYSLTSK
jgi:hypothetical protein